MNEDYYLTYDQFSMEGMEEKLEVASLQYFQMEVWEQLHSLLRPQVAFKSIFRETSRRHVTK